MFCENCGKSLEENTKFCPSCGFPVLDDLTSDEPNDLKQGTNETDEKSTDVVDNNSDPEKDNSADVDTVAEDSFGSEDDSAVEEAKSTNKGFRIGRVFAHFGAVILSLILFGCIVATVAIGLVHSAVSENTIFDIVSNVNLAKIKVEAIADVDELAEKGLNVESENLSDFIYDNINQDALNQPMTREKFNELVESKEIQSFVSETINKNLESLVADEETADDIIDDLGDFLKSERKSLSKKLGYELTDTRIENLKKTIKDKYGDVIDKVEGVKLSSIVDTSIATAVSLAFSKWVFAVMIILDVILAAVIYFMLRSLKQGTVYCGVAVASAGMVYLAIALAAETLAILMLSGTVLYFAQRFIEVFVINMIIVSTIMVAAGILIPIFVSVICNLLKKRKA